jgi:chromosome segregation ATPase
VLEEHYRRWFSDRAAVVALATSSIATFDDLRRRVEELDDRIESERRTLDAAEVRLNSRSTDLARREADLESLADSGRIDEYNAAVGGFNADVDAYNRALRSHREAVEAFNRRVDERNELAAAYSDLAAQIDTAATPLPQR